MKKLHSKIRYIVTLQETYFLTHHINITFKIQIQITMYLTADHSALISKVRILLTNIIIHSSSSSS